MRAVRTIAFAGALAVCACARPDRGALQPRLAFRISGDSLFTNARNLTVDRAGNVFIFDYDNYLIRRYDSAGTLLATFGGSGAEPGGGRFAHLMAIRADGDSLLALDAGSISVFDLSIPKASMYYGHPVVMKPQLSSNLNGSAQNYLLYERRSIAFSWSSAIASRFTFWKPHSFRAFLH